MSSWSTCLSAISSNPIVSIDTTRYLVSFWWELHHDSLSTNQINISIFMSCLVITDYYYFIDVHIEIIYWNNLHWNVKYCFLKNEHLLLIVNNTGYLSRLRCWPSKTTNMLKPSVSVSYIFSFMLWHRCAYSYIKTQKNHFVRVRKRLKKKNVWHKHSWKKSWRLTKNTWLCNCEHKIFTFCCHDHDVSVRIVETHYLYPNYALFSY